MARLVRHEADGPRILDPSDIDPAKGDIAICQCGLSGDRPFCDGSHRQTQGEPSDELFWYTDEDRHRIESFLDSLE